MKSVWGVPASWRRAARLWEMKLSVDPLSAIISAVDLWVPPGEVTGTSSNSKRLPEPGMAGSKLEGCSWGELALAVVSAWQ